MILALSSVPTRLGLSYCNGPELLFNNNETGVWKIALTGYTYMECVAFVLNGEDGICVKYYTHNPPFDHVDCRFLFCPPMRIYYALKYLALHKSADRMGTDVLLTIMNFHRFSEVEYKRAAVSDSMFI